MKTMRAPVPPIPPPLSPPSLPPQSPPLPPPPSPPPQSPPQSLPLPSPPPSPISSNATTTQGILPRLLPPPFKSHNTNAPLLDKAPETTECAQSLKEPIRCVGVGDKGVGKTSLLMSYSKNKLPDGYMPTVLDNYAVIVMVDGEPYTLGLFDTACEDYARLLQLGYKQTDIFLICFSVVEPNSFENVKEKWIPEIRHQCANACVLLVGTQTDLREYSSVKDKLAKLRQRPISFEQGLKLGRELKMKYVECSALTQKGLKNVFDEAIVTALTFDPTQTEKIPFYPVLVQKFSPSAPFFLSQNRTLKSAQSLMKPEECKKRPLSKVDISTPLNFESLGCTIVEMLTGQPPYAEMMTLTFIGVMYNLAEGKHNELTFDPNELVPNNSDTMKKFLSSLFVINAENRLHSGAEAIEVFKKIF